MGCAGLDGYYARRIAEKAGADALFNEQVSPDNFFCFFVAVLLGRS